MFNISIFRYVLGHKAMERLSASNVLIIGSKGLGLEISKNVVLAGVKSLSIYDPNPIQIEDFGSHVYFYLTTQVSKNIRIWINYLWFKGNITHWRSMLIKTLIKTLFDKKLKKKEIIEKLK